MTHTESNDRYMRITDVADYFMVTTQTIRNWITNRAFPKGEVFSPKVRRWRKSDIENYKLKYE